jgi:hypothetical protein
MNASTTEPSPPPAIAEVTRCLNTGMTLFEILSLSDDPVAWHPLFALELRSAARSLSRSHDGLELGKLIPLLETVADTWRQSGYELLASETREQITQIQKHLEKQPTSAWADI